MRLLFTLPLLALCACGGLPQVSAKKEWLESIGSFGFVPLYPMRQDVHVGDIRIHRINFKATGLNSRSLAKLDEVRVEGTELLPKVPFTKMALPRIDVTQIAHADFQASGLIGLWNSVVGIKYDSTKVRRVALTDLSTTELADHHFVPKFQEVARYMLTNDKYLSGICVAAKVMGDPNFEDTAISVITRVGYAYGIEFTSSSNSSISTAGKAENGSANAPKIDLKKGSSEIQKLTALNNPKFGQRLAFGVDAIMIDPSKLIENHRYKTANGKSLRLNEKCAQLTKGVITSPQSNKLTGARKRN